MGFHVELNSILRSDDHARVVLAPDVVYPFFKEGSRVFFDDIPIWLTRSDWTPLAEIQVLSQNRSRDEAGRPRVEGTFQILHVYPEAEQLALKAIFVRMFQRP